MKSTKKLLICLLSLGMITGLTGCTSSEGTPEKQKEQEEKKEPTDLTGTWASENQEGSYQEAIITNDKIEINWISPDSKALYWVGTYQAPNENVNEYSWTSTGDLETMQSALMASQDETKDFIYKNGVISYEVSALGVTKTIELKKQ